MFFPEAQVRVWLYTRPTDMRKSFDGLSVLVKDKLQEDPASGHLFVFTNRKRTYLKVLYFDRHGYCVWAKRLEQGNRANYGAIDPPYPNRFLKRYPRTFLSKHEASDQRPCWPDAG